MNKLILTLLLSLMSTVLHADDVSPDPCLTPQACISKISTVLNLEARPSQYPSEAEQAIIDKLLSFGDEGMAHIVKLLKDKDPLVARIGAVALRKSEKIDPVYLPAIVEGLDNQISWLAPALARIGTPEASAIAVERFIKSTSAPHNQEAYAIKLLGMKAVPYIIEAIKCQMNCASNRFYLLGSVLSDFKSGKDNIATELIKVAKDKTQNYENRVGALEVISLLGEDAKNVEADILALKESYDELSNIANHALIGIKSEHAARILSKILERNDDPVWVLREIAELGVNGKSAGEKVSQLLSSPDPQIKLFAARTLGYIEYELAVPKLIGLLNHSADVPINLAAVESLGRIKSSYAIPALREVALNHWHPSVREAGHKSLENINSKNTDIQSTQSPNFAFEYFSFQQLNIETCESIKLESKPEPTELKLYQSKNEERIEALAYKSVILSYGANDEDEQLAKDSEAIIVVNEHNMIENTHHITQIPDMALRVNNGWLIGSDRGEWGGELVFINDNGSEPQYLLHENIEDIYFAAGNYIAVTGLSHLSMNRGMIFKLNKNENVHWAASPWLNLPGAPRSSWFVETGELLINTHGGGSILLASDGSFRMAECNGV